MEKRLYRLIVDKENELYSELPYMTDSERIEKVAKHLIANGVVVLPCKIGDTVWVVSKNCAEPFSAKFRLDDIDQFGKRVFLTRAEALRRMRGAKRRKQSGKSLNQKKTELINLQDKMLLNG